MKKKRSFKEKSGLNVQYDNREILEAALRYAVCISTSVLTYYFMQIPTVKDQSAALGTVFGIFNCQNISRVNFKKMNEFI